MLVYNAAPKGATGVRIHGIVYQFNAQIITELPYTDLPIANMGELAQNRVLPVPEAWDVQAGDSVPKQFAPEVDENGDEIVHRGEPVSALEANRFDNSFPAVGDFVPAAPAIATVPPQDETATGNVLLVDPVIVEGESQTITASDMAVITADSFTDTDPGGAVVEQTLIPPDAVAPSLDVEEYVLIPPGETTLLDVEAQEAAIDADAVDNTVSAAEVLDATVSFEPPKRTTTVTRKRATKKKDAAKPALTRTKSTAK